MTTSENTTTVIVHEAINEEYEYIQYNKQLRLIRSVKDDMYQMQSIMNALRSTKQAYHWFENQQTKELLEEFPHMIASLGKPREEIVSIQVSCTEALRSSVRNTCEFDTLQNR
ncbi:KilA, N-terminal/APSES-type HTH, DNA-binding family [Trichomonas vaginalis G3]|uniref:KilA, N-terminal/APSES-type HTH, DNA-binding family n=1 Tax=Trichomonas vaginalis (strain ATCC PRA-98 / G3) TaxID=412133 RepID=UPI0021E5AFC5|nr:KilA, N-terminal/APSES-type HTH, DNA-binding family [Trichomonas vaginalis G3]KAI5496483.1 KilA, N-terminal/APSES-type HTH, DNA-binding family [Trichomonas vaginalis G3]